MTTIFYESIAVATLIDRDGISLRYEPSWEQRASAFPVSLTMPLRSGVYRPDLITLWLANLLPETHLSEIGQQLKIRRRTLSVCSSASGGTLPEPFPSESRAETEIISASCPTKPRSSVF